MTSPATPTATQYRSVSSLTFGDSLSGVAVGYTTDYTNKALGEVRGGSATARISGSASGLQNLTLTVNGVSGASFSEQFSAADLTTSAAVQEPAQRC
jgi:hypothetical protein